MKTKVLYNFRDKYNPAVVHLAGEEIDLDNDRVAELAARGLVKVIECDAADEAPKAKGQRTSRKAKPKSEKTEAE